MICLNQGILYRQQKPQNVFSYFSMFPNPAQETITVRFEIAEEHKTHWVIRNNIGQEVNFNIVSPKQGELEINIHDLVNGIYTVQLLSEDVLLHQEKLVIIR